MQRFVDYGLVLVGVAALFSLFRLSRLLLGRLLSSLSKGRGIEDADRILLVGFHILLTGLLLLPLVTAALAAFDDAFLPGGIYVHLSLVVISIILFSFTEDIFGGLRTRRREAGWTTGRHFSRIGPSLAVFWLLGVVFLSPLFYSGLTLVLAVFYLVALKSLPARSRAGEAPGQGHPRRAG